MNRQEIFHKHSRSFSISALMVPLVLLMSVFKLSASEEKSAEIKLTFTQTDTTKLCKAIVTAEGTKVKGTEVHFYIKSLYGLLPIGDAVETDSTGEAVTEYPKDLPGDKNGNYVAVAKIEDDDNYGNAEAQGEVKWGVGQAKEQEKWGDRSLSASRERAPFYLIIVSNLIIAVIWGTICYVIYQVFRIKKESRLLNNKN